MSPSYSTRAQVRRQIRHCRPRTALWRKRRTCLEFSTCGVTAFRYQNRNERVRNNSVDSTQPERIRGLRRRDNSRHLTYPEAVGKVKRKNWWISLHVNSLKDTVFDMSPSYSTRAQVRRQIRHCRPRTALWRKRRTCLEFSTCGVTAFRYQNRNERVRNNSVDSTQPERIRGLRRRDNGRHLIYPEAVGKVKRKNWWISLHVNSLEDTVFSCESFIPNTSTS